MFSRPARLIISNSIKQLPQNTLHIASPRLVSITQQLRMASTTQFKLNTGAQIPAVGFGTWQDKDAQEDAVYEALKAGYRHIDGARIYGTEPAVRKGIEKSGVPRKEIFITTKLWNNSHHPEDVEKAIDASLKDLGTDYVDLYLMHWPGAFARGDDMFPKKDGKVVTGDTAYIDTWKAMEKLQKSGKANAIGISNFSQAEIEDLVKSAEIVPAAHQIELHPYLQQPAFVSFHKKHGIHITQYSPFGNSNPIYSKGEGTGKLIDDPVLAEVGKKYGKTGSQVALAWGIAQGHSVIPKSKTPSRIMANLQGDFKLDDEDIEKISKLDKKLRFNDPSETFGYKFYQGLDGSS